MNVVQAIVRILKKENIDWLSCFPSNPIIEEAAIAGIRPISFRHERGASMAADGYSRMNNRLKFGVLLVQSQAGSENAMGGIAQAYADNVPILVIPGAPELDHIGVRPEFWPSRSYERFSKQAETIYTPNQVSAVMRRAFHALRNGRPGPVIVDIPADVGIQEVSESVLDYKPPTTLRQVPISRDIEDSVRALLDAKRPVIWAGMGVLLAGASQELTEFAELTEIPVYTSMPGKSAMDERHPMALGSGSGSTSRAARAWLQESDTLFGVGTSLTRTGYGQPIPEGKFIIHNTISQEDINKDHFVDIGLLGDAKETLKQMIVEAKLQIGESGRKGRTLVPTELAKIRSSWYEEWVPILTDDTEPINPYRVIWELDQTLDKNNSIVTHDAGAPRDMMVPFYTAGAPHSYIGWGKTTHLGYGIPLMIGAKLAFPERFCLNFMGDGAFGMSGMDIETSVRAGIPITTVVLNNGVMATYPGGFPIARERYGVTLMGGDYAKIAEGMGAVGIVVTKPSGIKPAIETAQRLNLEGKTVLLDIHTRPEDKRSGRS